MQDLARSPGALASGTTNERMHHPAWLKYYRHLLLPCLLVPLGVRSLAVKVFQLRLRQLLENLVRILRFHLPFRFTLLQKPIAHSPTLLVN